MIVAVDWVSGHTSASPLLGELGLEKVLGEEGREIWWKALLLSEL